MKSKPVIFYKHIHSGASSWSSNDVNMRIEAKTDKLDFTLKTGEILSTEISGLNGEVIVSINENAFIVEVKLESERTIYNLAMRSSKSFSYENKPLFDELVAKYVAKGFGDDQLPIEKAISMKREMLRKLERELEGAVIVQWSRDLKPEDYQGGLSDELFKIGHLQDYLAGGGCHGYIGHYQRTFDIDRAFEAHVKSLGYDNLDIALFMCGTTGRHFCDQLDNKLLEEEKLPEFHGYIKDYMQSAMSWIPEEKKLELQKKEDKKKTEL